MVDCKQRAILTAILTHNLTLAAHCDISITSWVIRHRSTIAGPALQTILNKEGLGLTEKITSTIKWKCGGMFLHASLQLDALRDCACIYDVEKTLRDFPPRIEDVYKQTWSRIIAQAPNLVVIAKTYFMEEDTNVVRFVHYTAKDAVRSFISETSPYPHSLPALVCMALLTEHRFQCTTFDKNSALLAALGAEPLLAYAHRSWSIHVRRSLEDPLTTARLAQFIQGCHAFPVRLPRNQKEFNKLNPLHMTAYFDLPLFVAGDSHLQSPNQPTSVGGMTPLILAIFRERTSAVRELLALPEILINAADEEGYTPLLWALKLTLKPVGCINRAIVALLLAHPNIDVNAVHRNGLSALMIASRHNLEEAASLLLSHPKIKVNQVGPEGYTALMFASCNESERVLVALLANPRIKATLRTKSGLTALDMAYYFPEIAELLRAHAYHERLRHHEQLVGFFRGMDNQPDTASSHALSIPSSLMTSWPVASQVLSNVHTSSGDVNVVGRDLVNVHNHHHHHHHHHHAPETAVIPLILNQVPNFRDIQSATLSKATEGTGDWICVWKAFIIWLASDGYIRILWGSGMRRSILASLAINGVENKAKASLTSICVGYLYIRYRDGSTEFTVRDLLEVLVKQTIERHPGALPLCAEVYARHVREQTEPSTTELVTLLKRFTSELVTASFYFVDALDEAPPDDQLELLEKLAALNVKLFITSRPLDGLESRFPDAHHFPIFAQDADLDVHIDTEISRSMELQAILAASSPSLGGRIPLTIKRKCSGMFLHTSLHLQALRECTNRRDLEKTLAEFPAKLADAYAETWDRIINQSLGKALLATNIFTWVLFVRRSLSMEELRHAVASCPDTHKFEPGGLVATEILISQVRLVHYTGKAVVQALLVKVIPYPHSLLAAVCMNRLSEDGFQRSSINSKSDFDKALKAPPLLPYAYHAWSEHAQASLDDVAPQPRLSGFLCGCHSFPILRRIYGILGQFGPLPVAAYFDLPLSLADSDYLRSINIPTREEGLTLLHLVCIGNARRVVKELLDLPKIQVNAVDKHRSTALIWASFCGNEHVVELLLSHPHIKINQAGERGITALHWASGASHIATVTLLLVDPKIKVNQRLSDDYNATALISAAHIGQTETVKPLLAHPKTHVNLVEKLQRRSALMYAVTLQKGDGVGVVAALLAHPQINVNQQDLDGRNTLQLAQKQKKTERVLLDYFPTLDSTAAVAGGSEDTWQSSLSRLVNDLSRIALPFGAKWFLVPQFPAFLHLAPYVSGYHCPISFLKALLYYPWQSPA
ncbi:hypothetical protein BKA70DRAFT_1562907 [Coprinopsis sp. MPI-PUGE-AT-0042]|nr:hypothetical protein BKA70DRAFT_1562907 [Coprinopsis sp. MPI-PUGE-AT-0042]